MTHCGRFAAPATALVVLLTACAPPAVTAPAAARTDYPLPPRGDTVDEYGGVRVADPYRPLEDLDAPATRAWVSAEARLTQAYLEGIPQRAQLVERLAQLYRFERTGVPFTANGRYFYTDNSGEQDQSVLLSAAPLEAPPTLALDPNVLPQENHPVVVGYVASHDARLLAYGVSQAGSDWTDWHIRDLTTGADRPDVLRYSKYYKPVFAADDRGLYYSAFAAPTPGAELSTADLNDAVYYHRLGSGAQEDRRLFAAPEHPDWQFEPHLSSDGRWLIISAGEGEVGDKGLEDVYLLDLTAPQAAPRALVSGFRAAFEFAGSDEGRLYFLTTLQAANGRVIAVDPQRPQERDWRGIVPEGRDAIELGANSVTVVAHRLLVHSIHDAHSQVRLYGLDGRDDGALALPGLGSAGGFTGHAQDPETFYSFADVTRPPTVYRYDFATRQSQVFRRPQLTYNPEDFAEEQLFYSARDGTRVPLLLAYRKGTQLKARNPLLLTGYGGFGISYLPRFDPSVIAWMEHGGVYAIANIRGGGEYGEGWHRQAIGTHKQVVFNDFIDAAEWLIAEHYTETPRLAIIGRSNGGLLVGACLTQRPELFGAAVPAVGVLDMLRFNRFGQGAGWEGDYGSPQEPQQFQALYAYSPVHNVRPGTRYPPTLIVTGDHDTRVMPMHSFKFTAALQAAQAGPAPILLLLDTASGHAGGETLSQAIAQRADIYAFLMKSLGFPGSAAQAAVHAGSH